jgi:hypothetical protein
MSGGGMEIKDKEINKIIVRKKAEGKIGIRLVSFGLEQCIRKMHCFFM